MEYDWNQIDEDNQRAFEKQMQEAQKGSAANKDFFGAALTARRSARENEILPHRDESGEYRYTVQQGLKAACHAREDITATLMIQLVILKRLDYLRSLHWVCIALLAYIAYTVS